jgi:hypothetical protein
MYGELQLALAFTRTNNPAKGDPKAVLGSWDKTKPLLSAAQGEGRMAAAMTGNPVVVLRPSNLIGIENDTPDGLERIAALALPETVTVRSSEPWKRHYWFRPWSETVPKFAAFRFEQGGVSADTGRYFLCPPAIHPSGAVYEFINSPADHEIAVISEDHYRQLVRLWKQTEHEERERLQIDPDAKVTPGRRRQAIFRYACQQRRWTSADEEIVQLALIWNTNHCDPPLSEEQVRYQVKGAMKKKGGQEVAREQLRSAAQPESAAGLVGVSVADVLRAARRYTDISDGEEDFILAALATAVSKALTDEEPLWLILVGASGGGKTEAIKLLARFAEGRVDELTRAGLLSWAPGRKAKPVGLLPRVPRSALVTISDFSTVVTMGDREARVRMFGMLRVVYDGRVYRSIGGQPAVEGDELVWEGHLTLIAAGTPVVDTHTSFEGALGERWLTLRLPESGTRRAQERARFVIRREDVSALREEAQAMAESLVLAARKRAPARLSEGAEDRLVDVATFVALARTGVVYEGQGKSRVITGIPTPEEPTRLAGQLTRLARCAVALGLDEEEALRLAIKAAIDSVPLARMRTLGAVAESPPGATVEDVRRALRRANWYVARWELDALESIGLVVGKDVEINGRGETAYALAGEYRGLYTNVASSCTSPPNKREETRGAADASVEHPKSLLDAVSDDDGVPF